MMKNILQTLIPLSTMMVGATNNYLLDLNLTGNQCSFVVHDPNIDPIMITTDLTFKNFELNLNYDVLNPTGFIAKYHYDNWMFFNEAFSHNLVSNPSLSFNLNFNAENIIHDPNIQWISDIYTYDFDRQISYNINILENSNIFESPTINGHAAKFSGGTMQINYKLDFGVILNNKDLDNDHHITDWLQICAHKDSDDNITFLGRFNIKEYPPDYPPSGQTPSLGFFVGVKEELVMKLDYPQAQFDKELRLVRIVNKNVEGVIY